MFYIILIIIAIFVYLIYKRGFRLSKTDVKEKLYEILVKKEFRVAERIKTTHLRDYMQTETILLDCGRKNFIRLSERFNHDEIKLIQVMKDWNDYLDFLGEGISKAELLDISSSEDSKEPWEAMKELGIKTQEIEKRFKELLGDEYIDPFSNISSKIDSDK